MRRQDTRVNRMKAAWGGLREASVHLAFAALAPVAVFANKGTVPLLLLAALPNLYPSAVRLLWHRARLMTCGILALCAWALISVAYAPESTLLRAAAHVLLLPLGLVWTAGLAALPVQRQDILARTLLAAMAVTVVLFAFEIVTGGLATRALHPQGFSQVEKLYERIAVGLVLLVGLAWPAAVRLWPLSKPASLAFVAAVGFCVLSLPMAAAVLGLSIGAVAFLLALRWPRLVASIALAGLLGYLLAAPTLSRDWLTINNARNAGLALPTGWEHRLGIWNYVAVEIDTVGLLGAGYDASRVVGRRDDVIAEIVGPRGTSPEALPLHPHNAVLQLWLELGLPGVLALAVALIGLWRVLLYGALAPPARAAAIATVATLLAPFLLSFGLWQSWWLATLMLCAGGAVVLLAPMSSADD